MWEGIKINQDVEEIPDILQPCEVVANLLSAEFQKYCWQKILNSSHKIYTETGMKRKVDKSVKQWDQWKSINKKKIVGNCRVIKWKYYKYMLI